MTNSYPIQSIVSALFAAGVLLVYPEPVQSQQRYFAAIADTNSGPTFFETIQSNNKETAPPSVEEEIESVSADPSDGPVTLSQLEQTALQSNPAIAQQLAQVESLRGKHLQAGLAPNPTVGYQGSDINEDGSAGRHGIYFGRQIVRGNKLGLSQSVVCAEIEAAEQRLQTMRQRLLTDVRMNFYDTLVAQQKLDIARELAEIAEKAVQVTTNLFEAAEVAQTSVLQAEIEYQSALVIQRQAENERTAAFRKLAAVLGQPQLNLHRLDGDPDTLADLEPFEEAMAALERSSPELAALWSNVQAAENNLARQRVEPIPNVTWQASVQYDFGTDEVISGLQAGMPIPTRNRNQGAIHQARHELLAAQHQAEQKSLELRQRLATAYQQYNDAKLQIDAFQTEILPRARKTYELILSGYRQGEVDFLQLLTAQRTYSKINLDFLEQLQQYWQQTNRIQGQLLSGSLEN